MFSIGTAGVIHQTKTVKSNLKLVGSWSKFENDVITLFSLCFSGRLRDMRAAMP